METKRCTTCNLEKDFSEFNKMKQGKFGLRAVCKTCHKEANKNYYVNNKTNVAEKNKKWQQDEKNKEAIRFYFVKRVYGIDKTEWLNLLGKQDNCCAICKETSDDLRFFHTDHDHSNGKVRGLLCKNCNTVLGHAKDNIEILEQAIQYLKRTKSE